MASGIDMVNRVLCSQLAFNDYIELQNKEMHAIQLQQKLGGARLHNKENKACCA